MGKVDEDKAINQRRSRKTKESERTEMSCNEKRKDVKGSEEKEREGMRRQGKERKKEEEQRDENERILEGRQDYITFVKGR